ncbi:Pentatricopeptide repeat domain [Tyrophagus putrescentiae]|nr:Pentatricopeptide repeat domain [Tyrophagus putrescentiae]
MVNKISGINLILVKQSALYGLSFWFSGTMQHVKLRSNYLLHHYVVDSLKSANFLRYSYFSTAALNKDRGEIVIPKAIKRGPTDILEALSSTIKSDFTSPHYKYLDDPYLTPISNFDKRTFSLAKEAGRKAAHYFFDKYPEYFYRDLSEPKIEAFTYKEIFDDSMEFEELDLQKCITRSDISNAIICYSNLVKQNKEISEETLLDLLDLVSFYNGENNPERYIEEDWFKKNFELRLESNFWKDNGFAEQLFESLKSKSSQAYSSLIMGMCRYFQAERAFAFYKQAIESGMKLNVHTYNALILASYNLHSTNEERWKTVLEVLKTMQANEIRPDLGTMNAVLKQVSRYKFWNMNTDLAKKAFNEFAFKFDIEPSLATYTYLLNVFHRSRGSRSSLIYEIMNKLNAKTFELRDTEDVNFFYTAMEVCFNMNDLALAYRVHELVEKNGKLLGRGTNQNIYFTRFLKLLCSAESFENFMVVYTKYVPNIYTPNIDLIEQILKTIKIYKSLDYVGQIWNDIVLCAYTNRIELLQLLLETMDEIKKGDRNSATFNNIVLDIFERFNKKIERSAERNSSTLQWTSKSLSYCISILTKAENIDAAFTVLQKLDEIKDEVLDQAEAQSLVDFCKYAFEVESYDKALFCLKYCREMDRDDVISAVAKVYENVDVGNVKVKTELDKFLK